MAKRIIIGNADFSENAIMIKYRLLSSILDQGMIDAVPGTGIRPPDPTTGNPWMNRVSLITDTEMSEYGRVTIPSGMQWCASFFDENGVSVGTNPTWVKNETGIVQSYNVSSAPNYASAAHYFHIAFGYIDGSQLDKEEFDTTIKIYLDKPTTDSGIIITSSMVEHGLFYVDGTIDAEGSRAKRITYGHQTFLAEYPRIYIPKNIQFCVLYRNDENETVNTDDPIMGRTTTPGSSSGGIVNITSSVSQKFSLSPTATSYYIGFGKIKSENGSDYLTPSELDTKYTIRLLPPN